MMNTKNNAVIGEFAKHYWMHIFGCKNNCFALVAVILH